MQYLIVFTVLSIHYWLNRIWDDGVLDYSTGTGKYR